MINEIDSSSTTLTKYTDFNKTITRRRKILILGGPGVGIKFNC